MSGAEQINTADQGDQFLVAAFYKFVDFPGYVDHREWLQETCETLRLLGTILLAKEGINGTVSGRPADIERLFQALALHEDIGSVPYKQSWSDEQPFYRMRVRLKKEIVTMGIPGVDPASLVGEYVRPEDWNALISRDDVRLIDTRNAYETHLGTFSGAEDPATDSFRDFPAWATENLDPSHDEHVAMFCTGGIRCEKATSWLKQQGFNNVYHLDGGILNYLEQVNEQNSLWQGDCFVFDNRVTVDHNLAEGDFDLCPACRMPLTDEDRASPDFELHVSCPKCIHRLTTKRRTGLLERAKQIKLAKDRGEQHIGNRQPHSERADPKASVPENPK